ncbi:MAG: VWA domain-containing protein [Sandaracinaceae bacterium]|nr:VWA domain-containing protein [Sandaracinaceae bacterium]
MFAQRECHPLMSPRGVRVRESRDSEAHPRSLGIVFALDVTGSMGDIPDLLARRELPKFMRILGECNVRDPQVLFMAVGDATCDRAPLQVGQFETTAELMDQWLTWSFLEGGGGPHDTESYELGLYFLAQHTDMDCWRKRQKRGYVFTTGDERPYPAVSRIQIEAVIGDRVDEDIPTPAVVAALEETFEPFFLIPDLARRARCERAWRDLLGDHVIAMESPADTCFVAAGLVALGEGVVADLDALARIVEGAGAARDRVGAVVRALTPYAALLGKDGAAPHVTTGGGLPGDGPSGWREP